MCSHGSIGAIHCYKEICLCLCVVVHNVCPFEEVMVVGLLTVFKASRYGYCWFLLQARLVQN